MLELAITGALAVGLVAAMLFALSMWRSSRSALAALAAPPPASIDTAQWITAVDMLARRDTPESSGTAWRLGGVYLLERLWTESPADFTPATDLLAAFVRQHTQVGGVGLEPTVEVQTVLTVLARSARDGLDLRHTTLWGADLAGARLKGANLGGARLRGASLSDTNLQGARLIDADLSDADLHQADLAGAVLTRASLKGADLRGANLRGADLRDADLRRANLIDVDLRDALLTGARFDDADSAESPAPTRQTAPVGMPPHTHALVSSANLARMTLTGTAALRP
jgi:uncharacterized protein YjbI with pentapeptide repeats